MTLKRPKIDRCSVLRCFAPIRWRIAQSLILSILCLNLCGCMFRRMTVRSDPPGAMVLVDGKEVGYTPMTMDFTYYGTREIQLIKAGYETRTIMQKVSTPWYQVVPLDFFTDNLLPVKVTNRHDFTYGLQPQQFVPNQELLDRAWQLRSESHVGP